MDLPPQTGARPNADAAVEKSTIRKISVRLVPFVALMFFINYLDRTAIGFAAPNGMEADLALSAAQFGFASGVFFIGYILLEVPSNLALHRFGARRWLARIMVSWGIVALLFTWVQNFEQLVVLRFLLGVAEAGFFPGAILFLSLWVPAKHRSKILALFYLAQPLTTVIGAPLAGLLIEQDGIFGLEGWRFMFLGVSVPAIIVGLIAWFYLKDKPSDAKWLTREEQVWLTTALQREEDVKTKGVTTHPKMSSAFKSGRVWMLSFVYFGFIYGLYALAFFLPTIIEGFQEQYGTTFGIFEKGLITAIPYVPAAIALFLWSRDATRRGVRTWHIVIPAIAGGLSIPLALFAGSPAATIAVITVTAMAIFLGAAQLLDLPDALPHRSRGGRGHRAHQHGRQPRRLLGPVHLGALKDATGGYEVPMFIVGFFLLLSALLMSLLARKYKDAPLDAPTVDVIAH